MKYSEFHRKILAAGWKFSHAEGSHYFYTKNGKLSGFLIMEQKSFQNR